MTFSSLRSNYLLIICLLTFVFSTAAPYFPIKAPAEAWQPAARGDMVDLSQLLPVTIALTSITVKNGPGSAIELSVTVRNEGEDPLTVLNWNGPLDPKAEVLDIFHVRDLETGTPVEIPVIKFSRKLPPPHEALVELPAKGTVDNRVTLRPMKLDPGRPYAIVAEGRWQAVWKGGLNEISAENLQDLGSASTGSFSSNEIIAKGD